MLTVEIWSDFVCPWCYLGRRRWAQALEIFPHTAQVRTEWRAFELRRDQPRAQGETLRELMTRNYKMRQEEIETVFERLRSLGEAEGIVLRPEGVRPVNSFDAHRLLRLAADRGVDAAMGDLLFAAYHTELLNIADEAVLLDLAVRAGLDEKEAAETLRNGAHAQEVRGDEARASRVGVSSVPSFVVGGRQLVHGAVTTDEMVAALHRSWSASV